MNDFFRLILSLPTDTLELWTVGLYLSKITLLMSIVLGTNRILDRLAAGVSNLTLRIVVAAIPLLALSEVVLSRAAVGLVLPVSEALHITNVSPAVPNLADGQLSAGSIVVTALLAIWIAGAAVMTIRLGIGYVMSRLMLFNAHTIEDQTIIDEIESAVKKADVRSPVMVRLLDNLPTAWVAGIFRPVVYLPENFATWSRSQRLMTLQHELIHTKRHDVFWTMLASLLAALLWFHPLVWLLRRRHADAMERTCDRIVLENGVNRTDYAQHIVDISRACATKATAFYVGASLAHNRNLKGRIMSILSQPQDRRSRAAHYTAAIILTAAVVTLLATLTLHAGPEPPKAADSVAVAQKAQQVAETMPGPDDFVEVDLYPEMIHQEPPVYSDKAKQKKLEGDVWIKALIDQEGTVRRVILGKSAGHKDLDEAALVAAWKNKFKPASKNKKPVAVWITYKVTFTLD